MPFLNIKNQALQTLTLCAVAFGFCSSYALATTTKITDPNSWSNSRQQYQIALKHLKTGKKQQFEQYKSKLEQQLYPLAPYLTYYDYRKNLANISDTQILSFIDQNWDSPISEELKQRWLKQLATQQNWDAFITHFSPEQNSKNNDLLCNQAKAWLNKGEKDKAFEAAEKLWLVGQSQSNLCDPLFNAWRNAGLLSDDLIWQRLELAMERANLTLARYLAKQLKSENYRQDFALWDSLFSAPHRLEKKLAEFHDTPRHRNIVLHILTRWVRSDKSKTLSNLHEARQRFQFTQAEQDRYVSYIARYISFTFNPESKYWLMEIDMMNQDEKVQDKRMEVALRSNDWPAVILWTSQKTDTVWEASKHDYWQARALEALAHRQSVRLLTNRWPSVDTDNLFYIHRLMRAALSTDLGAEYLALGDAYEPHAAWLKAKQKYDNLSGLRDFYGFLASERQGRALSLNDEVIPIPDTIFAEVENSSGFQRARELFVMNDKVQAFREWRHTLNRLPAERQGVAARVAESWGWNYQAILTAATTNEHNNLQLRFPKGYKDAVIYQSHQNNLDMGWVFAVIRQESAFRADARSGVGAMGLMQLMPGTAKHVSRGLGLAPPKTHELLTPEFNIRLGTSYLRELYTQFDQNIVMATAAYNAGPHRVKEWRPTDEPMAGDIWIETIPFKETKEYVKNILTYQAIYKYRMGLMVNLSEDIRVISPNRQKPVIQLPSLMVKNTVL